MPLNRVSRAFRTYHRRIAIILSLPLFLTVFTGVSYTLAGEWFQQNDLANWLLRLHSGSLFGLQAIYPILNGLGLVGLLVTGLSMTRLFSPRPRG